jgi:hypothetical protein
MPATTYHDDVIPRDTAGDDSGFDTGTNLPLSETEIEDLLYGEGRSIDERLRLLRSLRNDLSDRAGGDVAGNDSGSLLGEIDGRISALEAEAETGDGGGVVFDADPLAHRETLAPDSDELEALDEEDEASLDEEDEWLDDEEEQATGARSVVDDDFDDDDDEDEGDIDNDDDVAH